MRRNVLPKTQLMPSIAIPSAQFFLLSSIAAYTVLRGKFVHVDRGHRLAHSGLVKAAIVREGRRSSSS